MNRPWYRSKWLLIGGVILLLGVMLAVAIPLLVQIDRYRPLLVRFIETSTGRRVQIDALRLHMVPTVHIEAVNFRMKNPKGFPGGDAISMKSIDLGVAVGALLSRKVDVTYVALNGIRVHLLTDASGRTNFDLPAPPRSTPPGGTTPAAGGAPFLTLDHIGGVAVGDAEIISASSDPRHPQATPPFTLSGLNARIRSIDLKAADWPKKLEVVADLRGVRLTTPLLTKPVQFQGGEILYKGGGVRGTLSAALDTLHVNATAAVANLNPPSTVTFTVAVPEIDANRLQSLVNSGGSSGGLKGGAGRQAPPAQQHLLAQGEVKIDKFILAPYEATKVNGRLSVYPSTVRLDSYAFSAFGGHIQGAAALDYSAADLPTSMTAQVHGVDLGQAVSTIYPQARKITGALDADLKLATALGRDPKTALRGSGTFSASLNTMHATGTAAIAGLDPMSVTFSVAVPELDVNQLESLGIGSGSSGTKAGSVAPTSTAPPAPRRLLAQGDVKIDKLVLAPLAPFDATQVRGHVGVYTDTVQLDPVALSAFGGTIQGAAALNYSAASLPATVTAHVRGIDLGRVVSILAPQARKVTGALDADLKLATALGRDPRAALTGSGNFSGSLNNTRAKGTATIASLDPLSATFSVAIPELDVAKLESLGISSGSGGSPSRPTSKATPAARRLLARGDVQIDKLVLAPLAPFDATQVRSHVGVYTDTVQLDPVALSAYGGTIQGAAALDYSAASLPVAGTAKVRGVNLQRLANAVAPKGRKITGALEADLRLATALGGDPKAAMKGDGTFAVRNGTIQGLDLKQSLGQVAKALQIGAVGGETRFSYFGGDLRIAQQRVQSNSLRLNGEDLDGTGKGSIGFDKTLDYAGVGVLKNLGTSPSSGVPSLSQLLGQVVPGVAGITAARVPFTLRGTLDDPKFSLAGTPEFLRGPSPQQPPPQQPQQQPQPPNPSDLLKLFQ